MTPEAQRIAIAEACGLKVAQSIAAPFDALFPPHLAQGRRSRWESSATVRELPDYLADLNAMHEAEKTLDLVYYHKGMVWLANLSTVVRRDSGDINLPERYLIHATAAQRAEAFLKTLGKWQEEPTP